MNRLFYFLLLFLVSCGSAKQLEDTYAYIIIKNVSIVDIENGQLSTPQTVVIRDSIIYYVGTNWSEDATINAQQVDGTNRFLRACWGFKIWPTLAKFCTAFRCKTAHLAQAKIANLRLNQNKIWLRSPQM